MIFTISADEVNDCLEFALKVRQSMRQFGTREIREANQHAADTLTGKISELAMQKRLADLGLTVAVDFAHYAAAEITDNGQDIAAVKDAGEWKLCNFRVDSKGNAGTAQWLLVEDYKYRDEYAAAYVMTRLSRIPTSTVLRENPESVRGTECQAEVCGFVYREDFCDEDGEFWFVYYHGDKLIKTRHIPRADAFASATAMRANIDQRLARVSEADRYYPTPLDARENYAQPISWLRNTKEWLELISKIRANLTPSGRRFIDEYRIDTGYRVRNLPTP